jgi:hypothetical protein
MLSHTQTRIAASDKSQRPSVSRQPFMAPSLGADALPRVRPPRLYEAASVDGEQMRTALPEILGAFMLRVIRRTLSSSTFQEVTIS